MKPQIKKTTYGKYKLRVPDINGRGGFTKNFNTKKDALKYFKEMKK